MVDCPGGLVQLDSKQVSLGKGEKIYQFGALDCFTRKRVVSLAPQLNSQEGAAFLYRVVSEFLGMFGLAIQELDMVRYFNRPNYPQGNGRIERSFRTDEEEFYQVEDLPADLGGLEDALQIWNQITYEQVRPHEALGYKTPEEFYQDWLENHSKGKEVLSDMS